MTFALPNMAYQVINFWEWEQMTLVSGYLGITSQATQVILINMAAFAYQPGYGMQSVACTLIGLMIGKSDLHNAFEYMKSILLVFSVFLAAEISLYYYF